METRGSDVRIAFASRKRGVGKSTSAVNVAAALAMSGGRANGWLWPWRGPKRIRLRA